ncbi:2-octaprenyl-6-methoxyphenol hydroxylase oxidoreductase [Oryzomicrobium terrae]|uniref:2-octaprenyl-6-methoxyphenol hydroxylase oxidoreductase n=1 Tax=Oryzomicrobium terrae TaxID=1735038 RepID=A0A5C1EB59_9RHOO|nr:FAD-dependent monooxygenase [Oryzomicrobium terrae]QEL66096.1 2-octaprenyl-6-methoxyphenol hydroxylase oxidoreductase [Oryzomicrobium terrae]
MADTPLASATACDALHADILISGAGPVGLTLALALARRGQPSLLVDARPTNASRADPRALALSHGTRQLLEQLGAWPTQAATPITTIHVSQRGGFGRTLMNAAEMGVPALGYVVRYGDLWAALAARAEREGIAWRGDTRVADHGSVADGRRRVTLTSTGQGDAAAQPCATRLLVHAEGTPYDDPAVSVKDYGQHAVLAEVSTAQPHGNRAWERFTPDGPLALLPLEDKLAVVFTVPPEKAEHLLALDDAAFVAALQAQFGQRVTFTGTGSRASFPLALRLRDTLAGEREVWIGNTAQTLHPVSGQGFNLGLRDAWELAETLTPAVPHLVHTPDPGAAAPLAAYAQARRLDRRGGAAFTDGIVRLFSNDSTPLTLARGVGLLALDLLPPARRFVARRMIWGARAW